MECPVCHTPMIVLELDAVEIDYCVDCRGIWLDEGELEQLLGSSGKKDELMSSFQEARVDERPYSCPICRHKMKKVWVGPQKEVLIDECRKNHGLWFDKGELNQVIELGSTKEGEKVVQLLHNMFSNELSNQ